ncbi:T9SS type A sorting domain-containing protein [bacterium]|nr:T9SS type A sorting domain-containing protein [bacterium]
MRRFGCMVAVISVFVFGLWGPAAAWEPVDSLSIERLWFYEGGDSLALAYGASHDLTQQHPEITRVIINIHGASREAEIARANVNSAANQHDREMWDHLATVYPQFLFTHDLEAYDLTDSLLYWHNIADIGPSWCYGYPSDSYSEHPRPFTRSSFTCLDSLAVLVLNAFPNLENFVFAGHSAGARMIQRYAMATRWDENLTTPRILYNYANPAVYAYIGPERHVGDNWNQFAIPDPGAIADCPAYDDWPFGLQNLLPYFDGLTIPEILDQYRARHVIQWISELDTAAMSGGSQISCMAMMSGELHRKQRGLIYYNHVQYTFGGEPETFVQAIVQNLGHVGNAVYRSPIGRYYLFDYYDPISPGEDVDLSGELDVPNPVTVDGIISFEITVTNTGEETRTGDVWAELVSSDGETRAVGWRDPMIYTPALDSTRAGLEFPVPEGFPLGTATLVFNVGAYPDAVVAWDEVEVTVTSTTDVAEEPSGQLPVTPRIVRIAPNPFNASTRVTLSLPRATALTLRLYDVLGREVLTVHDGAVAAGTCVWTVNADRLAGGVYFLRASAPGGYDEVRKLLLVP